MSFTATIDDWAIQSELRKTLEAVAGIPDGDHRAWENRNFKPEKGEPWIRETLLFGDELPSANNELRQVGIYQVDYFVPAGYSIKDTKKQATAIKQAFAPDSVLGGLVRVGAARLLPGQKDPTGAWYQLPVQINYTVYSIN